MPTVQETTAFIKRAHAGQTDKAGRDYWLHPVEVLERLPPGCGEDIENAALLHDILEDTDFTRDDLAKLGYSSKTLAIVEQLTNTDKLGTYLEKIESIIASGNRGAILVKFADMSANANPERLRLLDPSLREKLTLKYEQPLRMLKAALEGDRR